jgi:hypothetical protein
MGKGLGGAEPFTLTVSTNRKGSLPPIPFSSETEKALPLGEPPPKAGERANSV